MCHFKVTLPIDINTSNRSYPSPMDDFTKINFQFTIKCDNSQARPLLVFWKKFHLIFKTSRCYFEKLWNVPPSMHRWFLLFTLWKSQNLELISNQPCNLPFELTQMLSCFHYESSSFLIKQTKKLDHVLYRLCSKFYSIVSLLKVHLFFSRFVSKFFLEWENMHLWIVRFEARRFSQWY